MVAPERHLMANHNVVNIRQTGVKKTRPALRCSEQLRTNSAIIGAVPIVTTRIGMLADAVVAVTVPTVLFFSITISVYYLLAFDNNVQITFPDIYASEKEWLFAPGSYGVLDEDLVYAFMSSEDPESSLNLTNAIQTKPDPSTYRADAPCIALMGRGGYSMYGLCDNLDKQRLPAWAADFEALTIQSVYLASVQEFRSQVTRSYAAVYQAFPNERQGWLDQATVKRLVCTTPELAKPVGDFQGRTLYTNEFGILTRVDCSKAEFSITEECQAIGKNPRITLFDDHTGSPPIIDTYQVFQSVSGALFIFYPFPSKLSIGKYTVEDATWPLDCCLYLRDGVLGWFGVGYTMFVVEIPTIALIAKIELISVISLIWLVHYRFNFRYAHHALFNASRLGVFGVLVLQIVISAYMEQDIMRTIFSWTRSSVEVWVLYFYVLSDVSMSVSLVALLWLRMVMGASLCAAGCILSIVIGFVSSISEEIIAIIHYRAYTSENGLLAEPSPSCGHGFTSCSKNKFNFLHLVFIWAVLPVIVEVFRVRRLYGQRRRVTIRPEVQAAHLTTFEMKCLDQACAIHIVWDMPEPVVVMNKRRQITADVICACGFTIIQNRFLIRTKDLWLLVLVEFTPFHMARNFSTVLWPLQLDEDGYYEVKDSKRVYINGIRRVHIQHKQRASLIRGTHHSLA